MTKWTINKIFGFRVHLFHRPMRTEFNFENNVVNDIGGCYLNYI